MTNPSGIANPAGMCSHFGMGMLAVTRRTRFRIGALLLLIAWVFWIAGGQAYAFGHDLLAVLLLAVGSLSFFIRRALQGPQNLKSG